VSGGDEREAEGPVGGEDEVEEDGHCEEVGFAAASEDAPESWDGAEDGCCEGEDAGLGHGAVECGGDAVLGFTEEEVECGECGDGEEDPDEDLGGCGRGGGVVLVLGVAVHGRPVPIVACSGSEPLLWRDGVGCQTALGGEAGRDVMREKRMLGAGCWILDAAECRLLAMACGLWDDEGQSGLPTSTKARGDTRVGGLC